MTLKEYKLGDRNFLFDDEDVPEGAKLVGDVKDSVAPITFEQATEGTSGVQSDEQPKAKPAPKNKAAAAPSNK